MNTQTASKNWSDQYGYALPNAINSQQREQGANRQGTGTQGNPLERLMLAKLFYWTRIYPGIAEMANRRKGFWV